MSGESESIKVVIDADRMAVSVVMPPGLDPILATVPAVLSALEERGVIRTTECVQAVESLVASYSAQAGAKAVVASGKPPQQGSHGRIELAEKFLVEHKDAAQPTNHYERTSYVTVTVGEVIGRVVPPVQGHDGIDVTGRALACKAVRPADAKFDDTIECRDDGDVVALRPGILVRSGQLIRISDTLELPEYVDFSTGNIHFPGSVRVHKGVRDCFVVACDGSLRIHGLVEAATLKAGKDVALDAGMAAREKGSLTVGRDLAAKYLEGVTATIGRDAAVSKEVTNSTIRVGRNLISHGLTIMGGSLNARGHVEVAEIGSAARVATEVVIGHDVELEQSLTKGIAVKDTLVARVEEIKSQIEALKKAGGRKNAMAAEQVTELQLELDMVTTKLAALRVGLTNTIEVLNSIADGKLRILSRVYPGVKIWIGAHLIEPRDEVGGVLTISITERGTPVIDRDGHDAASSFRVCRETRFADRAAVKSKIAA